MDYFCCSAVETQPVNVTLPELQRMWLASSRPAKKQATIEYRSVISETTPMIGRDVLSVCWL
jgi:hypothetical protein